MLLRNNVHEFDFVFIAKLNALRNPHTMVLSSLHEDDKQLEATRNECKSDTVSFSPLSQWSSAERKGG